MNAASRPPQPSHRRIIVIGHLSTDILAVLGDEVVAGSDALARIRLTGGGQAANTAAWLAWLGQPVTLVGCVGDDQLGRDRLAELTAAGVDCAVRRCPGAATGTVIVLSGAGERTMVSDRGANLLLTSQDVDQAVAAAPDAGHLHLSGYLLLDEATRPVGRHALAVARARGLTASVDAVSAHSTRLAGPAGWLASITGIDLLLANADEAAALTGERSAERAAVALTSAATQVVVKLGASGALWAGPAGQLARAAGQPVREADPTGAGDAFAAGLLAGLLNGQPGEQALRQAVELGAAAVSVVGARPTGAGRPVSAAPVVGADG